MATLKIRESKSGIVTTTDAATQMALVNFDVSTGGPGGTALDNCTIFITARASGYVTGAGTGVGEFDAAAFKVVAGTLSQIGATAHTINPIKDTGGSPAGDFSVSLVSATTITYYVQGVAATTIDWYGNMDIFIYKPV